MTPESPEQLPAPTPPITLRPRRLLVLIVCYRAVDLTIDCLGSLAPEIEANPGVAVAICENGTGGDAVETLNAAIEHNGWSGWAQVTSVDPNRGFSGGNNAVLDELVAWDDAPEHVLLLNADTIVRPGAIGSLLTGADEHPQAGIISPRLEWPDGSAQVSCFRHFKPPAELISASGLGVIAGLLKPYVVAIPVVDHASWPDWTSFACALIRTGVLKEVGTLDPGFFLYFDDPDYCRRARNAGYEVLNIPGARVVHLRGRSNPAKELTSQRKRRPWYHFASRTRFYYKHHGRLGLLSANLLWTLGHCIARTRQLLGGRRSGACEHEARDIWTNFRDPMAMPDRQQDG